MWKDRTHQPCVTLTDQQGCPRAARHSEGQKWEDQVKAKLTSPVRLV